MAHVKICTPYYSDVNDCYKRSMVAMSKATGLRYTWEHQGCQGVNPALSRNLLVAGDCTLARQSLPVHITHYLFADADIEWGPEAVQMLLDRNLPFVSGAYESRDNPQCWTAGMYAGTPGNPGDLVSKQSTGLVEVDWTGMGFALITRECLETLEYPYFRHQVIRMMLPRDDGQVEAHAVEVKEDIGMCLNLRAHGYKVMLDCNLHTGHECRNWESDRCRPVQGRVPSACLSGVSISFNSRTGVT